MQDLIFAYQIEHWAILSHQTRLTHQPIMRKQELINYQP